jgi:hypothetical protein
VICSRTIGHVKELQVGPSDTHYFLSRGLGAGYSTRDFELTTIPSAFDDKSRLLFLSYQITRRLPEAEIVKVIEQNRLDALEPILRKHVKESELFAQALTVSVELSST